ncbi:MAG TPA: hypothetical protein VGH13_24050 [Xanthobacteraceae bacterium]
MRCTTGFAASHSLASRAAVFAFVGLFALVAGSLPGKADDALVDVTTLPRLDGATVESGHSSPMELTYSVPGSFENTAAATKRLLAADGWKEYGSPSEEPGPLNKSFIKGRQGISLFFMMPAGLPVHSAIQFTADRLIIPLPFPNDATDIVFDDRRPYLSCVTSATIDAASAFFAKELSASGWAPLSAADAAAHWPNASLDDGGGKDVRAYYINEDQRPIVLSLQRGADEKTRVEIRNPPFAEPQVLEAGADVSDLPVPKRATSSGGKSSDTRTEVVAQIPAEISAVAAFYRREFASRNFKEEATAAAINPDGALLTFSSPDGTAVVKLSHKYDLTTVNLVLTVSPAVLAARAKARKDADDQFMSDSQDMVNAALASDAKRGAASAPASNGPVETLRALADNTARVPVPETAEDVDYDAGSGRLEFNSSSSFKAVVAFYRSVMKPLGWKSQPSVINTPTMVELDFTRGGKDVSFTIMQMGKTVNVTADGSAMENAERKPTTKNADMRSGAADAQASAQASDQDLEAEINGGLPVPKEHTLSEGAQTPFRNEVSASVPADLAVVLAFYRRELGKLNWTEDAKGAVVAADRAVVVFASPDGPAVLKLGRKNGETSVNLAVRNPQAAAKAGIMPKTGQAKVLFGNALPADAAVTINNRTVKVSGGVGTKGPDGPSLDLAPGKYSYSIKMPGGPAQRDDVEIGADETWGLLIGPGGALPLQMY